jgi:predicted ATPase/class 3 adenylate cyclase
MQATTGVVTFLFTDVEGSSRLWEREPARMRGAMERHDAIVKAAVTGHRGKVVKMLGDGVHAVFDDPLDAVVAAVAIQRGLAGTAAGDLRLAVRTGLHAGVEQERDDDYFGRSVNRAARLMSVAHGGQVLLSQAVAVLVQQRLPAEVTLRDLGEVRLRDLASAERVFQVEHPDLRADFPALRALTSTPNNLPQPLTSFVGREREVEAVAHLLAKNRLVTLTGVGGIGKTRLSLQVAAQVMHAYPDGVWLVELASLADARLVPEAVASVVGVKEEAGRPVAEALARFVRDRQVLIVLDNCEHLLQACAELASALLQAGAKAQILASSREPLHIRGEASFPVPPLPVPDPFRAFMRDTLEQYSAAQLFVERAVAAQPAFAVNEENAAAIAGICQRLDGIPLALELAAARVRALSVEQIATRLTDRFRLLTGGDRTALPRQQTLRALIDWSYDLLGDEEQVLFRRLAVFAGGFTLEAAEAVACASDVERNAVLDLLAQLVEKSLVGVDKDSGRYRMLETVRQYAEQRLEASGEAASVRTRHLNHFVALLDSTLPRLFGPRQGMWLVQLDLERENVLAAHAWSERAEDGAALDLRLAHVMRQYLTNRGLMKLALQLTHEALARPGAARRDAARSRACFDAGWVHCGMGQYAAAQALLEEGLAIARETGDTELVARILLPLGFAALGQGDRAAARGYLEEAVVLAREQGDRREIAAAVNALAQFHRSGGDPALAQSLYEQVLAITLDLGDRESTGIAELNLAMVAIDRGDGDQARALLLDALAIGIETGSKPVGQSVIEVAAGLAAATRRWERGAFLFGIAEAQNTVTGMSRDPADEAFLAPLIARTRDELGADAFSAAERGGAALSWGEAIVAVRAFLEDPR